VERVTFVCALSIAANKTDEHVNNTFIAAELLG
jgi:hypothetical protein